MPLTLAGSPASLARDRSLRELPRRSAVPAKFSCVIYQLAGHVSATGLTMTYEG